MLSIVLAVLLFVLGGFLSPVYATNVSFSGLPASLDKNQDVEIDVSLVCEGCTSDSYLRGVFYASGSNYFGFTKSNQGSWINASGTSCTEYYKVASDQLIEGSWSGKLAVKPDSSDVHFIGSAQYTFKVGRYTGGCGSPTWSSEGMLTITGATPTPTQPAATATATPTSTVAPTRTSTPTRSPTPTGKTLTPTISLTTTPTPSPPAEVLGDSAVSNPDTPIRSPSTAPLREFAMAFASVAVGLAMLAGVFIWQKHNSTT